MTLSRRSALLMLAALPAACASPDPVLYVLAPVPGPVRSGAPRAIQLRTVGVPHYLERSQIVRSSEGYRMDVLSNDWWGEPVGAMIGRILAQDLAQRLTGSSVYADNGAISTPPDATVETDLQRFDLDRDGALRLAAQIAVDGRQAVADSFTVAVRPTDATTRSLVAAMSVATGQLADRMAAMLAETPPPRRTRSP